MSLNIFGESSENEVLNYLAIRPDGTIGIRDTESALNISKGLVIGHSIMSKFGQNIAVGIAAYEDVWDIGGVYPYPDNDTAPITRLHSTSGDDTEPIEVKGLDINGAEVVQTKILTGLTDVVLDTPLWRVFRKKNVGTSDLVGDVHTVNDADDTIYSEIQIGNNQTLMALYTIPLGYTGYMIQGTNSLFGLSRDYALNGRLFMRPHGQVFQLKKTFALDSNGTSFMTMPFPLPAKIPQLTDIRVSAISIGKEGGVNTTFEIILVENG